MVYSVLCLLLCFLLKFHPGFCLIFPKDNVKIFLPEDYPQDVPFYEALAIEDNFTVPSSGTTNYVLSRLITFPRVKGSKGLNHAFKVNSKTGEVSLSRILPDLRRGGVSTFALEINATRLHKSATTTILVTHGKISTTTELCQPRPEACFLTMPSSYKLPETFRTGIIFDKVAPPKISVLCPTLKFQYEIVKGSEVVSLDQETGEVALKRTLDAERSSREDFSVACSVTNDENVQGEFVLDASVVVMDVDDNAPFSQPSASSDYDVDSAFLNMDEPLPLTFLIMDKDSKNANKFTVTIEDDSLDLFEVTDTASFDNEEYGAMLMTAVVALKKPVMFPGPSYNFSVVFDDTSYIYDNYSKVVFTVRVFNSSLIPRQEGLVPCSGTYKSVISKQASLNARVPNSFNITLEDGVELKIGNPLDSEHIFSITPKTGIVYVSDDQAVRDTKETSVVLNITWSSKWGSSGSCLLVVDLQDSQSYDGSCDVLCSSFGDPDNCNSSCGHGTPSGNCEWREGKDDDTHLTSQYSTCTPDVSTCPDAFCDELESMDKSLCPQDCVRNPKGEAIVGPRYQGILRAIGPCVCPTFDSCTCMRLFRNKTELWEIDVQRKNNDDRAPSAGSRKFSQKVLWTEDPEEGLRGDHTTFLTTGLPSPYSTSLIAGISVIVTGSLVAFTLLLVYLKRRRGRTKHKYVANRVPLSPVTSDYVDDRSAYLVDTSTFVEEPLRKPPEVSKWEFPRENLFLEETLGEGEFGKVMRAKALNIENKEGYSTVAVKMLKGNDMDAEERDLMSEFKLLQEVSHPNVVQLLGACTIKGGPLYIIVEYAEFGCLRNYLRRLRQPQSSANVHSVVNPMYFVDRSQDRHSYLAHVVQRELLSFIWQIAKGMAYLSDMKLVHRDLATRNVLLATGKVIKISDFGLSRDVYEGDTYLKTSKGRVPVKWLALESLEDHLYTSKSDVWSFGIVIWEILTLGSSPYPGIPPERLYQLLKSGYRMESPPGCPKHLYQIMNACWKDSPQDRPSFKELVQKLDSMLQDTVDYLPLDPASQSKSEDGYLYPDPVRSSWQEEMSDGSSPTTPESPVRQSTSRHHYENGNPQLRAELESTRLLASNGDESSEST